MKTSLVEQTFTTLHHWTFMGLASFCHCSRDLRTGPVKHPDLDVKLVTVIGTLSYPQPNGAWELL